MKYAKKFSSVGENIAIRFYEKALITALTFQRGDNKKFKIQ